MCTSLHFSLSWHEKLNLSLAFTIFNVIRFQFNETPSNLSFPSMKTSTSRTDTQTINIFSASYEIERRLCDPGDRPESFANTRILIDLCWLDLFVALRCTNKLRRKFPWEWRWCSACVTNSLVFIFVWCRLKMFLIATLNDGNKTYTLRSLFCVSK